MEAFDSITYTFLSYQIELPEDSACILFISKAN